MLSREPHSTIMVAGYIWALRNISHSRRGLELFVGSTCRAVGLEPREQLAILVGFQSDAGQEIAAEIAGVEWVDQHCGEWVMGTHGRAEADERWRKRHSVPRNWPFALLDQGFAVWLVPFDTLPAHLTALWNEATWLDGAGWQATAPERPLASMPCLVEIAGRWRLWIPTPRV